MSNKKAAIVVLYNPSIEILKTNMSYEKQFDRIYYIDNTDNIEGNSQSIVEEIKKKDNTYYISIGYNSGLAKALIKGCKLAKDDGFQYVCLLDQDTYLEENYVTNLISFFNIENVALVCSNIKNLARDHNGKLYIERVVYSERESGFCNFAITSGSIIDLEIYEKIGGFDEKLFIAQIDQDYCCKLEYNGYKLYRNTDIYIFQEQGKLRIYRILGRRIGDPQYSPLRYYYMFRNERYLRKKWGANYKSFRVCLWHYVVVILLVSDKKIRKLNMCIKGWFDGKMY